MWLKSWDWLSNFSFFILYFHYFVPILWEPLCLISPPAECVTGIPGTTTRDRTLKFDFIFVFSSSGVDELTENHQDYCHQIMMIMIVTTVILITVIIITVILITVWMINTTRCSTEPLLVVLTTTTTMSTTGQTFRWNLSFQNEFWIEQISHLVPKILTFWFNNH